MVTFFLFPLEIGSKADRTFSSILILSTSVQLEISYFTLIWDGALQSDVGCCFNHGRLNFGTEPWHHRTVVSAPLAPEKTAHTLLTKKYTAPVAHGSQRSSSSQNPCRILNRGTCSAISISFPVHQLSSSSNFKHYALPASCHSSPRFSSKVELPTHFLLQKQPSCQGDCFIANAISKGAGRQKLSLLDPTIPPGEN
eukprot:IDg7478t1